MNRELAKIFREMAVLLEIKGVAFKPRAFEKVAYTISSIQQDLGDIYKNGGVKALEEIPGIGKGIAERIEEYIQKGRIRDYDRLKKQIPIEADELRSVEGLGPKTILKLYKKLGITNLAQLKKAAEDGNVADIIGEKTQDNLVRGMKFVNSNAGRLLLGFNMPIFRAIIENLRKVEGVERVEFAGSIRRMQETVGDLDILAISSKPARVMDYFVSMPEAIAVYSKGRTKSSIRLAMGIDADLRVLPPESFGAALQYFTGDKYHNIELREIAIKSGYKLNEYGLYKGKKLIAGRTEEEIYERLGLEWMPPEIRLNKGELEAARFGKLPHLIEYDDLKGDLQVQTDWTDGKHSIKEMAEEARKSGLEYICITDHTRSLAMTGGSDEKKLLRQMKEVDRVQKQVSGIKILKGAEVNIMPEGGLDIDDKTLSKLDVVGAAVHSKFNMSEEDMTKRIIKAMQNPNIDIIFHPTGRLIHRREAYRVNMDELLRSAKKTGVIMEIDSYPDRLDLKDEYIRKAVEMGIKLSIDSDAHSVNHFRFLEFGIAQARRGWAEKSDIINTRTWKEMLKLLK